MWRGSVFTLPPPAPTLSSACVLFSRHVPFTVAGGLVGHANVLVWVGFPKLTDVRGQAGGITPDSIEVPSGSGRYYTVEWVDDVGKGYLNEYRVALAVQNPSAGGWPYPTP